jgi:hypothetical protein
MLWWKPELQHNSKVSAKNCNNILVQFYLWWCGRPCHRHRCQIILQVSPGQNAGDARKGEKTEGVSKALPLSQMTLSLLCAPSWMDCLDAKQRHLLSALQPNWPPNGNIHTHRHVATSMLACEWP